jgi:radical SAM superfamily enzyme YgiQ (UPF0313 family)
VPDIVLTTLNAKYAHAAFGLRYLMANLGPLAGRAGMLEFDVSVRSTDAAEAILAHSPKIVGIGVYIWNADQSLRLVSDLKRTRPGLLIVLGGPEVSHETDQQEITRLADYVITGEADLAFAALCEQLLAGGRPAEKIIAAPLPEFAGQAARKDGGGTSLPLQAFRPDTLLPALQLPYSLYTAEDIAHRVIYVEASRGCPFRCEFCLSSLDVPVRNVPIHDLIGHLNCMMARGARRFKFVDRTFNLNLNISRPILEFFLERYEPGMFLHFEMIPDRLPEALRATIKRFPPGALQFEVGIQTFDEEVSKRISRRQDVAKLEENLRWLRAETGVHVHADLIVGLPGEDVETFGCGFDRLVALGPQEIQVGMLKRLRGTPIVRHDAEQAMIYSAAAPYEVLQTGAIDFATMQRMRRFSRYWDLLANSGNFTRTLPTLWQDGSPFHSFLALSDWLHQHEGRSHAIALPRLAQLLFKHVTEVRERDRSEVASLLWDDVRAGGRRDGPEFLRAYISEERASEQRRRVATTALPKRQSRHLHAEVAANNLARLE